MKRIGLCFILSLWFITKVNAQDALVPIRVNDKYGLSNLDKEIKVKPIYDKINFGSKPGYFTGFKNLKNNRFTTSLLYRDQVIIKDKQYFDYSVYHNLIIGADTTAQKTIKYHNLFYNEKMQLYTKEGELLTPNYYAYIAIYEQINKIRPTNQLLVLFHTIDSKFSFKIYDTEKKEFIKTLLDLVDDIDFQIMDETIWALESIKLTYKKDKVQGKMEIKLVDNTFQIISDKKQAFKQKPKNQYDYNDYDEVEVPMEFDEPEKKKTLPKSDSITKTLKVVGIVKNHRKFQDTDKLYFENMWYRTEDYSLGFKRGKVGLIDNKKGEYIIPTAYDAIYKISDFSAFLIQKDNNKFGIYFSYTDELIEPIFEDIPVVVRKRFKDKGINLIALFDKDTQKLKCYSNFDGELFYID